MRSTASALHAPGRVTRLLSFPGSCVFQDTQRLDDMPVLRGSLKVFACLR